MNKRVWMMIIAVFLCHFLTAKATDFHSVCVGISDYPDTGSDLPEDCVNDAEDMADYLVLYQSWSSSNIELLLNSYAYEENISDYIEDMPNTTGNSELFFYSGHGSSSGLTTYNGTLNPSELESSFGSNFNQYCTFLNACHSGVFVNNMSKGEISSACKVDEFAWTGGPDDNCIYSYYVLEGIKNDQADPASGHVVSAKDVHDYAAPRVFQYVAQYDNIFMHPQFKGNLGVLNLKTLGPTTSGTLIDDELWDQNVTLTGNVVVPSGKILVIYDKTVSLNGYYIRCTGSGKIVKNGTVSNYAHYAKSGSDYKGFFPSSTTIQQIIGWASSGWDIFVASGTYTENLYMKAGVDVNGSGQSSTTINGSVYFNNDNGAGISNCTINGKIDLDYSDGVSMDNVKQVYQGSVGVDHYNSSSDINEFESTSRNYHGIYVHTFSDSYIEDSNVRNKSKGLFIVSSSDADAAYTVFCQNATDVIAGSGACYLHNCSFSSSTPGGSVSGNVTWNTWTFCGTSKNCSYTSEPYSYEKYAAVHQGDQIDPAEKDYFSAKDLWKKVRKAIKQEKKSGKEYDTASYAAEIREAAGKFKDIVSKYPTSIYTGCSLGYIARAHRILGEYTTLSEYVISLITDKKYTDITPQALSVLIPSSIDQGQYKDAISKSDQIIDTFPGSPLVCELIYGKGLIFKNYLNDINRAVEMFREVIERFPEHPTALSARIQLEVVEHEPVSQKPVTTEKADKPFNVSAHSYPNPFNPETHITFILPEKGRVIVNIYDIMGKQVRTLVNEQRAAGRHEVVWDGKNSAGSPAASGMYFYQITFRDKVITKKMMLVR